MEISAPFTVATSILFLTISSKTDGKDPNRIDSDLGFGGLEFSSKIDQAPITFRKCCAHDETFNSQLECVKSTSKINHGRSAEADPVAHKYHWFPSPALAGENLQTVSADNLELGRVKVEFASQPKCSESERIIVEWYQEDISLFFILVGNGSMVELDYRSLEPVASWPTESYCLDGVPNQISYYVAFLCPCHHSTCVRKCCPRDCYYNTSSSLCIQFQKINPNKDVYRPEFFDGHKPTQVASYYVLGRMPLCEDKKIDVLNPRPTGKNQPLYIQKNGSLELVDQKWTLIDNSRYCVDFFQTSPRRRSVNVLYCLRPLDRSRRSMMSFRKSHRGNSGYFHRINSFVFLGALLFV